MRVPLGVLLPPYLRQGIKTALAVGLTIFIDSQFLHSPEYVWAVLAAIVGMYCNVAEVVQIGFNRLSGIILGGSCALAFLFFFQPNGIWGHIALTCGVALCSALARLNSRYFMAAIALACVFLAGQGQADAVSSALLRLTDIGLGVLCAFVISVSVWPVRMTDALRQDLGRQFHEAVRLLDELVNALLRGGRGLPADLLDPLLEQAAANHEFLRRVRARELLGYRRGSQVLDEQVRIMDRCTEHLHVVLDALNDSHEEKHDPDMSAALRRVADSLMPALRHLGGEDPAQPAPDLVRNMNNSVEEAERNLEIFRSRTATEDLSLRGMLQLFSLHQALRLLAEDVLLSFERIRNPDFKGSAKRRRFGKRQG